jgi:hypothetical protein
MNLQMALISALTVCALGMASVSVIPVAGATTMPILRKDLRNVGNPFRQPCMRRGPHSAKHAVCAITHPIGVGVEDVNIR